MKIQSKINGCVLALSSVALIGCSTIVSGTSQPFAVKTEKVSGAKCELVDSKGARWVIPDTPGTVEITKGDGPLNVTCSKNGYKTASIQVAEGFAGATLGNVILGGGIGVIVDAASGAMQEYPDEVVVWLEPISWASAQAQSEWEAEKKAYEASMKAEKEQYERDPSEQGSYN